jgi:DNA-binding transcriptional ArsR family regulator
MVPLKRNYRKKTVTGRRTARKRASTATVDHGFARVTEVQGMPLRTAEGIEVLADPTRRRIVALLAARVWHPADIASAIGLSRPAVSRQLRLLTESGLVRWRWSPIDGRSRDYFIDPRMREPIIAWLAGVDLRGIGRIDHPDWSPPARVRRLRHSAQLVPFDREEGLGYELD